MGFRYLLRPLAPTDSAAALLQEVTESTKGSASALADGSRTAPWECVFAALIQAGAKTLLIQRGVRDPDFLEEHQAFYAKQHRPVSRSCIRIHAFSLSAPEYAAGADEANVLGFLDKAAGEAQCYLGFATIRPLRHAPVGASILAAPSAAEVTTADAFPVHIAGNAFEVVGAPFLQQDSAVGACAQASIWMALRTMRKRHGNAAFSPAELTVAATRYLANDRSFPGRQGLTVQQMLEAVRFAGHDPLHMQLRVPQAPPRPQGEVMLEAVPYLESGLPVILALLPPFGGHAVVAVGRKNCAADVNALTRTYSLNGGVTLNYKPASNWVSAMVIHNDNSGPYMDIAGGATTGYSLDHAVSMIVALPDRVFTTAAEAELLGVRALHLASSLFTSAAMGSPSLPERPFVLRSFLCTRHAFRTWAKLDPSLDPTVRVRYRTHELPKYMWVMEMHDAATFDPTNSAGTTRLGEIVIDASADPFHADGLIFASLSAALWPSSPPLPIQGILMSEDEDGLNITGLTTGNSGLGIQQPWM